MRPSRPCNAPGCTTIMPTKRGYCEFHYRRFMAGTPFDQPRKVANNTAEAEIDKAAAFVGDECLEWTMYRSTNGYPVGRHRKYPEQREAHRIVCLMVNGEPPDVDSQAAHSCGNRGCVNPAHLRWASPKENIYDRDHIHGTQALGEKSGMAKIRNDQAAQVIARLGTGLTAKQIASIVGVSLHTVQHIASGHTWKWLRETMPPALPK